MLHERLGTLEVGNRRRLQDGSHQLDAPVQGDQERSLGLEREYEPEAVLGVLLRLELEGLAKETPRSAAQLSEHLERLGPERRAALLGLEQRPQRQHELRLHLRDARVQKVGVQRIDPELQRSQTEQLELRARGFERPQQRMRQPREVRQDGGKPRRQRQAQLHDRVVEIVRVRAVQHRQQRVQARLQHGNHLAVQQIKLGLRQGSKQVPEQPHVRARIVNLLHRLEARLHECHDVRREHRFARGVLGHGVHEKREELEHELRLRRRGFGESAEPVPYQVRGQGIREAPAQRAGLQEQVRELDHGRELVRLASAEEVIDSEADDVDEISRVENRESLGEVRAHLGAFGALEQREAPDAVGDEAGRAAELAFPKPLHGLGRGAHLHLLRLLTEKVGHGPQKRLHADDERLDQRLGVREALDGFGRGALAAAVRDDGLIFVGIVLGILLLRVLLLGVGFLFVVVVVLSGSSAAALTLARRSLLAGFLLLLFLLGGWLG